jgi:hypothetical protein
VPGAQLVHATPALYAPALHADGATHTVAPAGATRPGAQAVQLAAWPEAYVLGAQPLQSALPDAAAYAPAPHPPQEAAE